MTVVAAVASVVPLVGFWMCEPFKKPAQERCRIEILSGGTVGARAAAHGDVLGGPDEELARGVCAQLTKGPIVAIC